MCLLCYSSTFSVSDDSLVMPRSLQAKRIEHDFSCWVDICLDRCSRGDGRFQRGHSWKGGMEGCGGGGGGRVGRQYLFSCNAVEVQHALQVGQEVLHSLRQLPFRHA